MIIGTIAERADNVYDEILTDGYSLLPEEVLKIIIRSAEKYATWSNQLQPDFDINSVNINDEPPAQSRLLINSDTILSADDWVIIEPVVVAHIDLTQARRNEAAGITETGMPSSEARQLHKDALADMEKRAFQFQPFTISTYESERSKYENFNRFNIHTGSKKPEEQALRGVTISKHAGNIISKKADGLYAEVATPDSSTSFVEAFNAAINEDD